MGVSAVLAAGSLSGRIVAAGVSAVLAAGSSPGWNAAAGVSAVLAAGILSGRIVAAGESGVLAAAWVPGDVSSGRGGVALSSGLAWAIFLLQRTTYAFSSPMLSGELRVTTLSLQRNQWMPFFMWAV